MTTDEPFEIFLVTAPGLEAVLCDELVALGYGDAKPTGGGVTVQGSWVDVWRLNVAVRGASRVLARIASFRALHLAQLDKRARKVPWGATLRSDVAFRVEATCKTSKIYHSGAAAQRIANAICDTIGAPSQRDAEICVRVRIENNLCTISVDTSGELLHKRGHKEAVNKAPMRETMAALILRSCGFDGREPVLDPMCGSGTFVIEAAEWATGLMPGRTRAFAFEKLATFDLADWQSIRDTATKAPSADSLDVQHYGSDRDAGAVRMSCENAQRAGVDHVTNFTQQTIAALEPPCEQPGLVIANPPYGGRIGDKKKLAPLYRAFGETMMLRFSGWRIGLITTDKSLADATRLPFGPPGAPVAHGGLNVRLFQTEALA